MQKRTVTGNDGIGYRCSRRSFIKGGTLLAGAALMSGALTSQAAPAAYAEEGEAASSGAEAIDYVVYDTDLLIIGAGLAGMSAGFYAEQFTNDFLIVDKGPYSFSGAAGMNWDEEVSWIDVPYEDWQGTLWNETLENQEFVKGAFEFSRNNVEALDLRMHYMRNGGTTWARKSDGTWENLMLTGTGMNMVQGGFSRHMHDQLKADGVHIVDNTMITELIIKDGMCQGAVGVNVRTGEYRVFRAKATMIVAGGTCQMYGWVRTHPHSMNTPDNTGDLEAAAYRHGLGLVSSEFFGVDLISVEPASLGCSFNSGMGADGNHMTWVCDKDDNFFMRDFIGYDISRPVREAVVAGICGEHGGPFLNLTDPDATTREAMRPVYSRNIELWKDQFGIDVTEEGSRVPVALEAFEHGQGIYCDGKGMTEATGLFTTRGIGRQRFDTTQFILSPYVTQMALDYIGGAELQDMDWSLVEGEIERLEGLRTHATDGLRPMAIRHQIQEAFYSNWEPTTNADKLNACLAELERIKGEMANTNVASDSKRFNLDWKNAIENENLMICTEATVRSALAREESRFTLFRDDFPEASDEWLLNIVCRLDGEAMGIEKHDIVTV